MLALPQALPSGRSPLFVVGIIGSDPSQDDAALNLAALLSEADTFRSAADVSAVVAHHDAERGVLYLAVAANAPPPPTGPDVSSSAVQAWLADQSYRHARGLLLLSLSCDVVLVASHRSSLDVPLLKTLRAVFGLKVRTRLRSSRLRSSRLRSSRLRSSRLRSSRLAPTAAVPLAGRAAARTRRSAREREERPGEERPRCVQGCLRCGRAGAGARRCLWPDAAPSRPRCGAARHRPSPAASRRRRGCCARQRRRRRRRREEGAAGAEQREQEREAAAGGGRRRGASFGRGRGRRRGGGSLAAGVGARLAAARAARLVQAAQPADGGRHGRHSTASDASAAAFSLSSPLPLSTGLFRIPSAVDKARHVHAAAPPEAEALSPARRYSGELAPPE